MLPQRKHTRLKNYDYSKNGYYFITICTKDKKPILGKIVGRDALIPPDIILSNIGKIVDEYINNVNNIYNFIKIDKYVIMPNHIHMIIKFEFPLDGGMLASRPTLHTIIRSIKTMVTKELGYSIWQSSYYEHIIRNQQSYQEIWQYIDNNPLKWELDELYI